MLPQVAQYFEQASPEQQKIMSCLRDALLQSAVHIEEKWRFKIPFYDYYGMCFYFGCKKDGSVELGFIDGARLSNAEGLLTSDHLKQVWHYKVDQFSEIDHRALAATIQEALMVREMLQEKKSRKRK